jgi:hypothetical protein
MYYFYICTYNNVVYLYIHIFKMKKSPSITLQQSKHTDTSINRYNINISCNQKYLKCMFIVKNETILIQEYNLKIV